MLQRLLVFLCFSTLITGCATFGSRHARYIKEVDWPITNIRAAISAQMPVPHKSISSNGREITSQYFAPAGADNYKDGENATVRYYVQYAVLGDRRPYNIEILVTRERRVLRGTSFVYENLGPDQRMTLQFAERLRKELTKRREDRNIIDDFRIY